LGAAVKLSVIPRHSLALKELVSGSTAVTDHMSRLASSHQVARMVVTVLVSALTCKRSGERYVLAGFWPYLDQK